MKILASEFTCPSCGGKKFKLENDTYPTLDIYPPISAYDYRCQECGALIGIRVQDGYDDGKRYVIDSRLINETD